MVLNGAWDSNLDEVEEARKGLGEEIDNLLCSAFDWTFKVQILWEGHKIWKKFPLFVKII